MPAFLALDWTGMFAPSQPVLETVIRGSAVYLCLFLLLRILRRQIGSIGPADLLVLLLLADASQNAMAGEYRSITDGLLLAAVIVSWEYLIDLAAFRIPAFGRLLERPPLPVVEDGRILPKHLQQELMSEDDLRSLIRQKGIDQLARVRKCFIEGDGSISVIPENAHDEPLVAAGKSAAP